MSFTKEQRENIIKTILLEISNGSYNSKKIEQKYKISRQTVQRYIRRLREDDIISRQGTRRNPIYKLIFKEEKHSYKNENLDEQLIWSQDIVPFFKDVNHNTYNKLEYIFCEIFNNAIDHSGGSSINVSCSLSAVSAIISIKDNGIGIFTKLQQALNLPEKRFGILELYKGKLTTDPHSHSGEGIFFSSRIADIFAIFSDDLCFCSGQFNKPDGILFETEELKTGTMVLFEVNFTTPTTIKEVFDKFTEHPEHVGFTKTQVPVRMLNYGTEQNSFVSRSQAKRLMSGFDRFSDIVLDFEGVDEIRQGFADEIFRVFQLNHPECKISIINANSDVKKMIDHVIYTKH